MWTRVRDPLSLECGAAGWGGEPARWNCESGPGSGRGPSPSPLADPLDCPIHATRLDWDGRYRHVTAVTVGNKNGGRYEFRNGEDSRPAGGVERRNHGERSACSYTASYARSNGMMSDADVGLHDQQWPSEGGVQSRASLQPSGRPIRILNIFMSPPRRRTATLFYQSIVIDDCPCL